MRRLSRLALLVTLLGGVLALGPPARADGRLCNVALKVRFSPGFTFTPARIGFSSGGQRGAINCPAAVTGPTVTGTGNDRGRRDAPRAWRRGDLYAGGGSGRGVDRDSHLRRNFQAQGASGYPAGRRDGGREEPELLLDIRRARARGGLRHTPGHGSPARGAGPSVRTAIRSRCSGSQ